MERHGLMLSAPLDVQRSAMRAADAFRAALLFEPLFSHRPIGKLPNLPAVSPTAAPTQPIRRTCRWPGRSSARLTVTRRLLGRLSSRLSQVCLRNLLGYDQKVPHGSGAGNTTCHSQMRSFQGGTSILIGPWRAAAPPSRDWVPEACAYDRNAQAGEFVLVHTGEAPDTNLLSVPKARANVGFEPATCVLHAVWAVSSEKVWALLFVAAKLAQLHPLPQHQKQRDARARLLVDQVSAEGSGSCTDTLDRKALCHMGPTGMSVVSVSEISVDNYRAVLRES